MKHFYFFTKQMVSSFRVLALTAFVLLGVGNAWGASYTLEKASMTPTLAAYSSSEKSYTAVDGSVWKAIGHGVTSGSQIQLGNKGTNYILTPECSGNISSIVVNMPTGSSYYVVAWDLDGNVVSNVLAKPAIGTHTLTITGNHTQLKIISTRTINGTSITTSNAASYYNNIVVNYTPAATCTSLAAPSVTATPGNLQAQLSWDDVTHASSYTLIWNGGSAETGVTSPVTKSGLTNGVSYSYSVMAVGDGTTYCADNTAATGNVTPVAPAYTVTPSTNNASYGTVSVLGNVITATPAPGYTYASPAYTVLSGTATVSQSGDEFTVTPSTNCAVRINFQASPTYTLSLSNDGGAYAAGVFPLTTYAGNSTTLPTLADCGGYTFVGWDTNSATTSAPTYAPEATYTTTAANVTLYAVYSITSDGGSTPATTSIAFSTVNNGWTKSLSQTDGGDYWKLFLSADYFLSPSIDLSTITAVFAKIGTYGGGTHTLSVQDESGNVWGTASSSNSNESATSVTKTGSLSGTGKVKFVCTTGNSGAGLRTQELTIHYAESSSTTTYTTLPGCCTAHNTSFTAATVSKTDNDAAFTNALINGVNTSTKAFTSSDPTVATVNATTGEVTILKAGTTTINLKQAKDATYCAVDISYTLTVTNQIKNAWMQWPTSGSTRQGLPYVVYGKVNEPGVTDADGNGALITAWIGYSSTNNDPSLAGWTWVAAPFNERQGNDYEYSADLGAVVTTPGTYYYATRFQIGSAAYVYGGYGTGYTFWNGTTSLNQQLIVTAASVNWANVQWPASGSCTTGGTFDVYAQVHEAGITDAVGQGAGIQVWIGRSTSNATHPNTWDESAWVLASYHADSGNNDEYVADIATDLTPGTYYYASRIQLGAGAYQYGGYNGGFWNGYFGGSGNLSGRLVVNNATVAWCNLQSPATGSIFPNSEFNAYARVYEDGVTNVAGAGDNLTVWIGYSTSNTDPSTWTNWVAATYTQDYGSNDEYVANIGATLGEGTYYYASRVQLGLGAYKYGGYSEFGGESAGGFWDGSAYVSGVLTVAQPKYTVTFDVGTGTAVSPLTQASYGASITLPTASAGSCASSPYDWTFAGWSETALVTTETTTAPTLLAAGASYTPVANKTLYAVYKKTIPGGFSDVTESYGFETGDTGWTVSDAAQSSADKHTGTYSGLINKNGTIVEYNTIVAAPKTFTFWLKKGSTNNNYEAYIEVSSNGSTWTKVGTYAMSDFSNSEWRSMTADLSSYSDVYVRFSYYGTTAVRYVDDVSVTHTVGSSVTNYHSTPVCIACDASSLAVTSPQSINLDAAGDAELDISTLVTSNSNGAITYALTPTSANAEVDAETGYFLADAVGTYTVTISQAYGTELPTPHCPASVTLTINVLATPVVTIVDVTPLTFTANCGEASAAESVSVTGYNLTADMTATAPTNFLVSSDNITYGPSATFGQAGGTASGTLYIKANPPAGSTTALLGDVTLTSTDATTRTLAVSATVSCTPVHVYFNDKGNVVADSTEYVGGTITFPANPSCTDANYEFDGWYTGTLNDAASYAKVTAPYTVTGETTLYAVYRKLTTGGGSSTYTGTVTSATWNAAANNAGTLNSVSWQAAGSGGGYAGYDATKGHQFGSSANFFTSLSLTATSFTGSISQVEVSTSGASDIKGTVSVSVGGTTYSPATETLTATNTAYTFTGSSTGNVVISWANTSAKAIYLKTIKVTHSADVYKYTTNPLCCPNQLATPANFAASAGDTQVVLTWDPVANASSGYNIECVTNPAKSVTGVTGTSTTITGLTNCTEYSFKITAIGDNVTYCQSPPSSAVTSMPRSSILTATFNPRTYGTCAIVTLENTCLSNDITLPTVTPIAGYVFDGWRVDDEGTLFLAGATYTLTADVTLVAKYHVIATYSIDFINEGVGVDSLQQVVSEGLAGTNPNIPMVSSCSEYLFKGWSTTAIPTKSSTAPTYYNFATPVTGPVTLYAVYSFVDTSNGGSNDYTLVKNKADLVAGSKVIIGSGSGTGAVIMGPQSTNNRPGLSTDVAEWTKSGIVVTLPSTSTVAVFTVGVDDTNYTFNDGVGYLYAASSGSNYLRTKSLLDDNGKWALGAINGTTGECASVVAQGTYTRNVMALNGVLFACYSAQSSYGKMYFYKNLAASEYTTSPVCSPMIVVDPTDVEDSIHPTNLEVGLGGIATSAGHTVFAKNCSSAAFVQPVLSGVDKSAFSINWTRVYLDNGAMDSVYTVSYSPVTGTEHHAFLYFETNDQLIQSATIPLYGKVCTSLVFGAQSATDNSITINWLTAAPGSTLRIWNEGVVAIPGCPSGPQPKDTTITLGSELTKTILDLRPDITYYYQATTGPCISEKRAITTAPASGVPVLTSAPSTLEFTGEVGSTTVAAVALTGLNMNSATVSVAITGDGAAVFTAAASITLDATGKGTLSVTYKPVATQTYVAIATITYASGCVSKTIVVNLVGNVPGIDVVEINPDAGGFTIHTEFEGTPDIVLSQEVEHAGTGKVAKDLFFSKYYEAYVSVKLVGIYNGTKDPISLTDVRVVQRKAGAWSAAAVTEIVDLGVLGDLAAGKEIILYTSGTSGADTDIVNCVKEGVGFDHEGWYPVGNATALKVGKDNLFGSASIQFAGDKSIALQRKRSDGTWAFIDLIGAGDSITSNNTACVKISANDLNDATGWYCADGVNYKTKEPAPLSTNRHLLIRKNTVVDGMTAVAQNTTDMVTLCPEWEGLNVPKTGDQAAVACEHFSAVAEFNYDGYYASFERVDEGLVTFTAVGPTAPGDWVGQFDNPTETFQDTLRCYNLQISVLRYFDMRNPANRVELSKTEVQTYQGLALANDPTALAIIAALDTVEVASTQFRVPIIVKSNESIDTKHARFTDLSADTCKTCDVVILNKGTLTKSNLAGDRDSVRSVIVYNGGRLIVNDGLDYKINDLQIRAKGDSVGAAYVEGILSMKNPRVIHDKRIENDKPYFFALPYDCPINRITQMNGKPMGPYGVTWMIRTYDGAQRITNGGKTNNWKTVDAGATLKAGVGYVLYLSSDIYKYVRFPMSANTSFTEKNTAKSMDVTQYGHAQAYGTDGTDGSIGWNNVGWNLVGNPYVSYFMAKGDGDSIMTGSTMLKGRYLPNGGFDKTTWKLDDTDNVYITVPDAVADGGYLQKRVSLTQLDPFISFFVQADRTGSLNFETSSREEVAKVMRAPNLDYNEIVLNFDVAGKFDQTTIILDKERNLSYEIGKDLLKWKGKWGKTPYVYSFDSKSAPLAFNAINYDEAQNVPIAFYMPTSNARYTFSLDRNASILQGIEHVYLLRGGSIIADLLTTDYTATNLKLKAENKEFAISIQRAAEVVTPVNPADDGSLMPYALTERHEVRVEQLPAEGTVMVMDAVGRTIATRTLTGADNMTFELPVDGVYTITVMTPARNYILKTVIR